MNKTKIKNFSIWARRNLIEVVAYRMRFLGIDENGMAAREVKKLKAGDKIAPVYYIHEDDSDSTYTADAYEWADGDNVIYAQLPNGDYYYAFSIDDIYGDYCMTDPVVFTVGDDGISFSELE